MHLGVNNALSIGTFTGNGGNISLPTDAIETTDTRFARNFIESKSTL